MYVGELNMTWSYYKDWGIRIISNSQIYDQDGKDEADPRRDLSS